MGIILKYEVKDPKVEETLRFLSKLASDDIWEMLDIAKCTVKWLELRDNPPSANQPRIQVYADLVLVDEYGTTEKNIAAEPPKLSVSMQQWYRKRNAPEKTEGSPAPNDNPHEDTENEEA